jgi:type III pantothenate kinase
MVLAIDIGNTNIDLGLFSKSRLVKRRRIPTKNKKYLLSLKKIIGGYEINDVIICSVVPRATKVLKNDLKKLLGKRPQIQIIGKDIVVPIRNLYRQPKQVGSDRLVNAYAGHRLYGSPLIVVDFGTAITFDVISKNKEYLGGIISPGLKISLDALATKTALLPKVKLEKPKELIGRDTRNSMLSGIVYGFAALTDSLVQRLKSKLGINTKVIGTGGDISLISKYCKQIDKIDKDLTLKGLSLIYNTDFHG